MPVHFVNGVWGVLAVGLFANSNPNSASWNGVIDQTVTGLFYGGGFGQLGAQVLQVVAIAITAVGLSYIFFRIVQAFGLLRSNPEHELQGLDLPEMGAIGYPKDWEPATEVVKEALGGKKLPAGVPASD